MMKRGLLDWMQGARWEELGGCKVLTKVCNLGKISILVGVYVERLGGSLVLTFCFKDFLFSLSFNAF